MSSKERVSFWQKNNLSLGHCQLAISFLLLLILLSAYILPKNEITRAKLAAGRWPLAPTAHLQLAKTFFNNNREKLAVEEYQQADQLHHYLGFLNFNGQTRQELDQTKMLVHQPSLIKEKIVHWQKILATKPNYRDALLNLSLLNHQAWQNNKAEMYWQKAFYLDPNNPEVNKVGQLLGIQE